MGSTILAWSETFDTLTKLEATIRLNEAIRFVAQQRLFIKLIKVSFSSNIPNIYTIGSTFNNGLVKVSKTGGAPWTSIQLPDGIYTSRYVAAAINTAIASWWTDEVDPGFTVSYNSATQLVYIDLDSSKLVGGVGQLAIDLSASDIHKVLGYNTIGNQIFNTDGLHGADSPARFDYIGNTISVILTGFGPLAIKSGARSEELCTVPLSTSTVTNEYIYPSNGISTPVVLLTSPPVNLTTYKVAFFGSRLQPDGTPYPLYILEGAASLEFELRWS